MNNVCYNVTITMCVKLSDLDTQERDQVTCFKYTSDRKLDASCSLLAKD